jgi:hypothetical protein
MSINVLDVITEVIMDKKMIFVSYFPDDMLNGCMTLSSNAELAFRRIVDLIYTNDDKLYDDAVIWELITRGFNQDIDRVKSELIKKGKIYIENELIKNKRCTKEIEISKERHEKAKRGAEARWNKEKFGTPNGSNLEHPSTSDADAMHMLSNTQYLVPNTHNKNNIYKYFDQFWDDICYKVSKGQARKNFVKVNKEWQEKPKQLSELYNKYYESLKDKEFAQHPSTWLSAEGYLNVKPKDNKMTDDEFKEWQWNKDIEMRKKGIKTMRWTMDYIRKLDLAIADGS